LISITDRRAADSVPPAWIQAHGHAQIFGWIGSFILGIGFYSIPKLRRAARPFAPWSGWLCWTLWAAAVALRWAANVYLWHWRALLPATAMMEVLAFLIFLRAVSGHKAKQGGKLDVWVWVVIIAALGFLGDLLLNLAGAIAVAAKGAGPAFPGTFDQHFLVLSTWGFLVPFVWGFSARWLPVFLGLRPVRERRLLAAGALNTTGVASALAGQTLAAGVLLVLGSAAAIITLRLLEPAQQPAKIKGVHSSFPLFVRLAYVWLLIAGGLGIWAATLAQAVGAWGASRHALTVGFLAMMVFSIGQRILPAFSGMRLLFSTRLMFAALALLALGCTLRVSCEALAYQGFAGWAWSLLPVSAVIELSAVTAFAVNLAATFIRPPKVAGGTPVVGSW
ncbi:MAG TPA: NnrS family protein, partial [Terriglobales bacterium]|nr:NnrS family protein [Terriglobales bacterium]